MIRWQETQDTRKRHQHKVTSSRNIHVLVRVMCQTEAVPEGAGQRWECKAQPVPVGKVSCEYRPCHTQSSCVAAYTPWVCCSSLHLIRAGARYPLQLYYHCSLCWFNRKVENSVIKLNALCLWVPPQKWFLKGENSSNQCVKWLWISWRNGS